MLDALSYLLCLKLYWHNRLVPNCDRYYFVHKIIFRSNKQASSVSSQHVSPVMWEHYCVLYWTLYYTYAYT